jgi:thiamine biosynthesis lipoprotein
MHIGFGAIGKGYAADRVKKLFCEKGVQSGVINASGDLTAWGMRADGQPWKTGIADPDDLSRIVLWLPVNGLSVATSGNYIQYFDHEGTRYSHNINPLTGYPVKGIKSVTIISPGAELSDALATAVTVMGVQEGIQFINQLPETHCIIIDDHNKVYQSKNLQLQHAV